MKKKTTQDQFRTKSNDRWKWMAGAIAATASTPHTQAQTAQISLINNQLDSLGGALSLSITQGHAFGTMVSTGRNASGGKNLEALFVVHEGSTTRASKVGAAVGITVGHKYQAQIGFFTLDSRNVNFRVDHTGTNPQNSFALIPLTLTDPNVAKGQPNTNAILEIEDFIQSSTDETIQLLAMFYPQSGNTLPDLTINSINGDITGNFTNVGSSDDGVFTADVPEPTCSSLALLALGAGGILARRKFKKAA